MKYDLNISCVKFLKINQHKFVPLFFVQFFVNKSYVANIHKKVHPFSFFIQFFIHKYLSSMNTWQNILPHHQIFYPMCQIYLQNILLMSIKYSKRDSFMFTYSHSPNNIHVPNVFYHYIMNIQNKYYLKRYAKLF